VVSSTFLLFCHCFLLSFDCFLEYWLWTLGTCSPTRCGYSLTKRCCHDLLSTCPKNLSGFVTWLCTVTCSFDQWLFIENRVCEISGDQEPEKKTTCHLERSTFAFAYECHCRPCLCTQPFQVCCSCVLTAASMCDSYTTLLCCTTFCGQDKNFAANPLYVTYSLLCRT